MGKTRLKDKIKKVAKEAGKASTVAKVAKFAGATAGVGLALYGIEKGAEYLGVRGGAGFIGKRKKGQKGKVKFTTKQLLKRAYDKRAKQKLRIGNLGGARKDLYKKRTVY